MPEQQQDEVLTSERVEEIYIDCLFRDEELVDGKPPEGWVHAYGVVGESGFQPDRLETHREEVRAMLHQLPEQFMKTGGGGWSFLNACEDNKGRLWTGMHQRMDQLFQLGTALGLAQCQFPREVWAALPGGMPYYVVIG